ncbi:NAD(P)HX dehydratase isoform X1 [Leptinotarsa decemlineata]|uniref:NAD(P)HX dehydratase isoform X1 n=1 Tax=Leptinotarsa decemlineata TaxID=7539 RepID=UPI003D308C73
MFLKTIVIVVLMLTLTTKLLANVSKSQVTPVRGLGKKMCDSLQDRIIQRAATLAPPLTRDRHKGQAGRIGIFGGSIEYTGAPYFSSISALKVGADLSYVFCNKEAATVIKSYSPELIVLPVLDDSEAIEKIEPWLERLHVVLIGPGLGRQEKTFRVIEQVIESCRNKSKPMVIDADGLFLISQKPEIIKNYPAPIILTPNVMEFNRLVQRNDGDGTKLECSSNFLKNLGGNITLLCKDTEDEIISNGTVEIVKGGGSGRRCGGQGDLLGGALSTFFAWAVMKGEDANVACYAAAKLTRECNARAFAKFGRSMTTTDMIEEIHGVFADYFELE